MGLFFVYILKASCCLAVFYLFYRLLLSKETFHRFNRMALLGVLVLSCLLPLLALMGQGFMGLALSVEVVEDMVQEVGTKRADVSSETSSPFPWNALMLVVYVAGVLFFLARVLWSVVRVLRLLRSSRMEQMEDGITLFVHRAKVTPFSWMKVIVVSEEDLKENGRAILTHERAHIRHLHSWDLLLVEVCTFFQWFNPAVWLLKQELQNIHEYEADEWVINNGIDARSYQLLIIKKTVGERLFSMVNGFNHSFLKKRIAMMIRKKSNPWARLKCLYVLPLAALSVTVLAHPEVSGRLDGFADVRVGQLASLMDVDEEDVLKYSFLDNAGLRTNIEMRRDGSSASRLVDSVRVVVDENTVGYGLDALNRIPGEQIAYVLAIPGEATIEITTKEGKKRKNAGKSKDAPLIVLDGELKGTDSRLLKEMDVNDIKSVVVVKNRQMAEQLYGEEAKHGLLIIETKQPKHVKKAGEERPGSNE